MGIERMREFWPEWKVTELLGEGSYGKVYKAVREDHSLTSFCAIKIISVPKNQTELGALHSEGMTDMESKEYLEEVVSDFINEIKLMEALKGTANIVSVEDYRILEKKNNEIGWDIYIRMELLQSFSDVMSKGSVSEQEVIKLGIDLCSALELCAKNNIIHRDIKPANIFISKNGDYKLGDFGVAKELGKTSSAMSSKGTYSYMAPEVANHQKYDLTVDIYSLGIVMYTLLNNNRQPFVDPRAPQISYNERMEAANKRLSGQPMPAPCNAPKQLSDIILTACAFDPAKRFRSATAFKNALISYKNAPAAPAVPVTPPKTEPPKKPQPAKKPEPNKKDANATVTVPYKAPSMPTKVPSYTPMSASAPQVNGNSQNSGNKPPKKKKTGLIIAIIAIALSLVLALIIGAIIILPALFSGGDVVEYDDPDEPEVVETDEPETEVPDTAEPTSDEPASDEPASEEPASEDDGLYWDLVDGTLIISGKGAMPDFAADEERPWESEINSITAIEIEEGVTRVGDYCFASCYNCAEISLPSTLKSIGEYAFNACADVTTLAIPEGVEAIEKSAFQSCWAITGITIPSTVETIGDYAFSFHEELSSIFVYTDDCEISKTAIFSCSEDFTIYCSEGSTFEEYAKENGYDYYAD